MNEKNSKNSIKQNNWIRNLVLIFGSVFVALVLCELLLWALIQLSPGVRFALRPWAFPRYLEDQKFARLGNPDLPEHDRMGFRNGKVPDQVDIIALGDSNTYGHRVSAEEAWPRQLAKITGRTVYNMGISGWSPPQFIAILPRALELEPRILLICVYTGNDFVETFYSVYHRKGFEYLRDPMFSMDSKTSRKNLNMKELGDLVAELDSDIPDNTGGGKGIRNLIKTFSRHLNTLALIRSARLAILQRDIYGPRLKSDPAYEARWQAAKKKAMRASHRYIVVEEKDVRTILDLKNIEMIGDVKVQEGFRASLRALSTIAEENGSEDVKTVILILPTKESVFYGMPFVANPSALEKLSEWEETQRVNMKAHLDAIGVESIDLTASLKSTVLNDKNPYFETDNTHINAIGQAVVAQTVAEKLGFQIIEK